MRVAFDLDDTLIPVGSRFPTDPPSSPLVGWLTRERLRVGAGALLRELAAAGHEIWIYTTSLRPTWRVRLLFWSYGVTVAGVVNAEHHSSLAWSSTGVSAPSKYPPAFGIDVLIDNSVGVRLEGETHGFRVVTVEPSEEEWTDTVRNGLGTDRLA